MAEKDIGALVVTLEAQTAAFQKGMQDATKELNRFGGASKAVESQLSGVQGAFLKFNVTTQAIATGMNLVSTAFGKIVGFARVRESIDNVQASFTAVLGSGDRAADMMERVYRISNELGTGIPETANAVRRMAIGLKQLGSTNAEIEKVTSTFLKIGAIGGSIEEATAAIFQFSQALGSGTLRGDELVSLLERQPLIAQEIAKYMKDVRNMGDGSVGSLRKLASEGKVTSEILKSALIEGSDRIAEAYKGLPVKISQAFNRIQNAVNKFYIDINKEFKINEGIGDFLSEFGEALNYALGNVLTFVRVFKENWDTLKYGVAALAAVISGPLISALIAATLAAARFAASFGWISVVVVGATLIITAWDQVVEVYKKLEITVLETSQAFLELIGLEDKATDIRIAKLKEEVSISEKKRNGDKEAAAKARKEADDLEAALAKMTPEQRRAAEEAKKFREAAAKSWESFKEGIFKARVETSMFEGKIKELERLVSTEKDPKLLKEWTKQLQELKASGNEFEAWLLGLSKKSFGDSLKDMETQLLSLEALLTTTNDPAQIKKWTLAIKQLKGSIGELEEGPLYAFKQQLEDVTAVAQLVPEKIALIDAKLKGTDLTKSQRDALLKLRDEVQGLDSDFIKLGQSITDSVAGNATNSVNNFIDSIGKAKFSFADFTESVLKDIAKIIFQLLIMQPIVESIKRSLSSFGASGGPELLNSFLPTSLEQGVYDSPQVFKFADGGVFGSRMGVMGEAGPEAIMPLKRNSSGRLGVEAAPTNITIINNAGAEVQATETTNSDGTKQIDIYVERKVKEMFGGGAMDKSMKSSYGITRVGV